MVHENMVSITTFSGFSYWNYGLLFQITAPKNKSMAKDAIESLDSQFNSIQHDKAINISSTSTKVPKDKQKIAPMSGVLNQPEVDMDGLMTSMDKLKDKSEESKWHSSDFFTSETKRQIHPDSGMV